MTRMTDRIALFLPSLHCGGAERALLRLAGAFAASGFDVRLGLASAEGPYLAQVPRRSDWSIWERAVFSPACRGWFATCAQYRPVALLSAMEHANIVALCARETRAGSDARRREHPSNGLAEFHSKANRCEVGLPPPGPDLSTERHRAWSPYRDGVADDFARLTGFRRVMHSDDLQSGRQLGVGRTGRRARESSMVRARRVSCRVGCRPASSRRRTFPR